MTGFSVSNAAGQTHTYVLRYSPISGRFQFWRTGVRLGGWLEVLIPNPKTQIDLRVYCAPEFGHMAY